MKVWLIIEELADDSVVKVVVTTSKEVAEEQARLMGADPQSVLYGSDYCVEEFDTDVFEGRPIGHTPPKT